MAIKWIIIIINLFYHSHEVTNSSCFNCIKFPKQLLMNSFLVGFDQLLRNARNWFLQGGKDETTSSDLQFKVPSSLPSKHQQNKS